MGHRSKKKVFVDKIAVPEHPARRTAFKRERGLARAIQQVDAPAAPLSAEAWTRSSHIEKNAR